MNRAKCIYIVYGFDVVSLSILLHINICHLEFIDLIVVYLSMCQTVRCLRQYQLQRLSRALKRRYLFIRRAVKFVVVSGGL